MMRLGRLLPPVLGCLAVAAATGSETLGASDDATCAAGEGCAKGPSASGSPHYYWPSARGRHESPSRSPYKGPKNLTKSLAWTWRHPEGQYRVIIPAAPVIDDRKNLYLATTEEIFSFDSNGNTRWKYTAEDRMSDNPSLWNGALYTIMQNGVIVSLDMESGMPRWKATVATAVGGDIASVTAHEGRVYATVGTNEWSGSERVVCVNATDGEKFWEVKPDTGLWNFIPMFPGDGNVIFQTQNGDPYVVRISDGQVLWSHHREPRGWTDGGTTIGPNGIAYVTHADGHIDKLSPFQTSDLTAHRISDGEMLWRHEYPTPPNSWPVVAQVGESKRWTVLFPYGGQSYQSPVMFAMGRLSFLPEIAKKPAFVTLNWLYLALGRWGKYIFKYLFWLNLYFPWPGGVTAFEPETGKVLWEWHAPDWWMPEVKGDDTGLFTRTLFVVAFGKIHGQTVCIPNPWASPTVDADGTAYLGFQDGVLYALREKGGKGEVADSFTTSAGFSHPGIAMAPGMLAVANCDTLYVFKYEES